MSSSGKSRRKRSEGTNEAGTGTESVCYHAVHGGGSAPSCCAFTHRVAFEEGSGPRVLLKSGPGSLLESNVTACVLSHIVPLRVLVWGFMAALSISLSSYGGI